MARFEIPEGWTVQGYRFAFDPTPARTDALLSHAGGARFAYNTMLAAVTANLDQRAAERSWSLWASAVRAWPPASATTRDKVNNPRFGDTALRR